MCWGVSSPRLGPFVLPQPGITGRYLQQECGAATSARAGIPHPFKCARQQRFNCYHTRLYRTPKHTLWVFGRAITPPFYHPPSFITPPNTPCGCSDVLSPPPTYHPPPWAPCELHFITWGTQDITPPQRIPHPVIIFFNTKMLSPGCVILCQLR